jgi:hypothetical protein
MTMAKPTIPVRRKQRDGCIEGSDHHFAIESIDGGNHTENDHDRWKKEPDDAVDLIQRGLSRGLPGVYPRKNKVGKDESF